MYDIKEQHLKSVFALWSNWLVATGSLLAVPVLGLWISCTWLPLVVFAIEIGVYFLAHNQAEKSYAPCALIPFLATRILFWSGIIMVGINLLYSYRIVHRLFDPDLLNASIPYLPILIVAPVTALVALSTRYRKGNFIFCQLCQQRNGMTHERGFIGKTYNQESGYQTSLLINLFTTISVICWSYYLLKYINVNLNRADTFMFVWCPVLIWLIVGLHIGVRYSAFWNYYNQNLAGSAQQTGLHTRLRMLLVYKDCILLRFPSIDSPDLIPEERKIDTPCHLQIRYTNNVTTEVGRRSFEHMVKADKLNLRFLYSNVHGNPDFNMFHYVAFINDEEKPHIDERFPDCRWVPIFEIQSLLNSGLLSPFLSAEIIRIHTVAMAWKTYDLNGRRLYKIKNYRPSFHLEEMKDWDVDYNDPRWLFIAFNNEDVPFWKLRKLWYRHISGVENR